jgi:hypothetical protein
MREKYQSGSGVYDQGNPHALWSDELGVLQTAGMQSVGYLSHFCSWPHEAPIYSGRWVFNLCGPACEVWSRMQMVKSLLPKLEMLR